MSADHGRIAHGIVDRCEFLNDLVERTGDGCHRPALHHDQLTLIGEPHPNAADIGEAVRRLRPERLRRAGNPRERRDPVVLEEFDRLPADRDQFPIGFADRDDIVRLRFRRHEVQRNPAQEVVKTAELNLPRPADVCQEIPVDLGHMRHVRRRLGIRHRREGRQLRMHHATAVRHHQPGPVRGKLHQGRRPQFTGAGQFHPRPDAVQDLPHAPAADRHGAILPVPPVQPIDREPSPEVDPFRQAWTLHQLNLSFDDDRQKVHDGRRPLVDLHVLDVFERLLDQREVFELTRGNAH